MNLEEVIGQDYTVIGKGRYLKTLEHDSLVIDIERQIFFWNSRSLYGSVYDWLTRVKGFSHEEAKEHKPDEPANIFDAVLESKKGDVIVLPDLVNVFYDLGKEHRGYWKDVRGYTDETISRFKLGYSGTGWYTIPIFVNGVFRNFQCRREDSRMMRPWYKNLGALPFNFGILNICSEVFLTEGPVDAIMLRQNGLPAVSQTSGAGGKNVYKKYFHKFSNIKKVFIVYDNDDAGKHGAKQVAGEFGSKAIIYNLWDFDKAYDITDFFKDGHTAEELVNLVKTEGRIKEEWV